MSLFNFKKKKNENEKTNTCCYNNSGENTPSNVCGTTKNDSKASSIKVLGTGCKSCHALLENTKTAVESLAIHAEVEYVTDMQKIMEYGVMSMPALVVNEKVISQGKVLKACDVEKILKEWSADNV